jgi:hypothetical protein
MIGWLRKRDQLSSCVDGMTTNGRYFKIFKLMWVWGLDTGHIIELPVKAIKIGIRLSIGYWSHIWVFPWSKV